MLVETRIAGIPCTADVHTYKVVKPWGGSAASCPSSDDYYGYVDVDYTICDRRGRAANWLERKMTAEDKINVEQDIADACAFRDSH